VINRVNFKLRSMHYFPVCLLLSFFYMYAVCTVLLTNKRTYYTGSLWWKCFVLEHYRLEGTKLPYVRSAH